MQKQQTPKPIDEEQTGRVRVFNFDPVEQAKLWVSVGPERAIEVLSAYLRTAVLLGEYLVLDRNDLLDGIFFLSLGPEGISEILGTHTHEKLPILLMGSPITQKQESEYNTDTKRVLPTRNFQEMNKYSKKTKSKISLDMQLEDVDKENYWKSSSAFYASLCDSKDGLKNLGTNTWMIGRSESQNFRGSGFTHRNAPLKSESEVKESIRKARKSWINFIYTGRMDAQAFLSWSEISSTVENKPASEEFLERALKIQSDRITNQTKPLQDILNFTSSTRRKDLTQKISNDYPELKDDEKKDLQTVWSKAYAQALSWKDSATLLTFPFCMQNKESDSTLNKPGKNLISEKAGTKNIKIPEKLITNLSYLGPESYRLIYKICERPIQTAQSTNERASLSSQIDDIERKVINISFQVAKLFPDISTHESRKRDTYRSVILKTSLAFILFLIAIFGDVIQKNIPGELKFAILLAGALITFAISLPISELIEAKKLINNEKDGLISVEFFSETKAQ